MIVWRQVKFLFKSSMFFLLVLYSVHGYALPNQGTYDNSAAATISTAGTAMSVAGKSTNNVLNWEDFSIASGEKVAFDGNNYLNLVHGDSISTIAGILTGTGNIYLVNPNGVLFSSGATVDVGSLYVSTRPLNEVDSSGFSTNGTNPFSTAASSYGGDITNLGNLQANYIYLEGDTIVLGNTADITSNGTDLLTNVTLNAGSNIEVGYSTGTEATEVNSTEYTDGYVDKTNAASTLGYIEKIDNATVSASKYDYMLVRNAYELQNIQNNLSGNYMLSGNIDASVISDFTPIGSSSSAFEGNFDGLGYEINELSINSSKNYIGLFGYNTGTIKNVGLNDSNIIGYKNVGGIVGYNAGTIENSYNTGSVYGYNQVGGIAGYNAGTIKNSYNTGSISVDDSEVGGITGYNAGTIENSYNAGSISGGNGEGGIAGFNSNSGIVKNSFNTGNIISNSDDNVGGIVGWNQGTVEYSYNTGDVLGENSGSIGGIVGWNQGTIEYSYNTGAVSTTGTGNRVGGVAGENDSVIKNTYSTGNVSGTDGKIGGVAGTNGGTITDSYYNTDNYTGDGIGYDSNNQSGNVYGLTTSQLMQASTYANWSIDSSGGEDTIWRIYEGYTYPLLKNFLTTITVSGSYSTTDTGSAQSVDASKLTYDNTNVDTSKIYSGTKTDTGSYALSGLLYSDQQGYDLVFSGDSLFTINVKDSQASGETTIPDNNSSTSISDDNDNISLPNSGITNQFPYRNAVTALEIETYTESSSPTTSALETSILNAVNTLNGMSTSNVGGSGLKNTLEYSGTTVSSVEGTTDNSINISKHKK